LELLACIVVEKGRKQLLEMGQKYGLTSPKVIRASQQLDKLLNLTNHQPLNKKEYAS
jgi:hypothetical protein